MGERQSDHFDRLLDAMTTGTDDLTQTVKDQAESEGKRE